MSFQSVEVASEGSTNNHGRQWRDNKSEFELDITNNVQLMQEAVRRADDTLHKASKSFLSKAMDASLAKELKTCEQLEQQTEQIFRDWTVHMAGEPHERHRKRFACDKLRKAFDEEVACLKDLARRANASRHLSAKHVECAEEFSLCEPSDIDGMPTDHTTVPISDSFMDHHQDVKMESKIVFQRDEIIKHIQSQMVSVNQIFKDLASIVTEQGRQMETIEQHADESGANSKRAAEELQKAFQRQVSTGHLWFVILAVTLFVCVAILMHMSATSTAGASAAAAIDGGRGVGIVGVAKTSGFATGFGTRVISTGNALI